MFPELQTAMQKATTYGCTPRDGLNSSILLRDTDADPDAGFLIHHFVGLNMRESRPVVLCSFSQTLLHFSFVAKKLGMPLGPNVKYIDCVTSLLCGDDGNATSSPETSTSTSSSSSSSSTSTSSSSTSTTSTTTKPTSPPKTSKRKAKPGPSSTIFKIGRDRDVLDDLFTLITTTATTTMDGADDCNTTKNQNACLILDDIGVLVDLGVQLSKVVEFVSRCRSFFTGGINDGRGSMVTLCHADPDDDDEFTGAYTTSPAAMSLAVHLSYQADIILDVQGLQSGYSKDVHGQLSIRTMPSMATPMSVVRNIQFKTRDNGVSFFAPGTSAAVL